MPVEFEEQEFNQPLQTQISGGRQGGVTGFIFKLGLAKNATQANVVMLVVTVIATGLAIYFALPNRVIAPVSSPAMPGQPFTEGGL